MRNKYLLRISHDPPWSWKRRLLTFGGVYGGIWGFLEPIGAFTSLFSLSSAWGLLGLFIPGTLVTVCAEVLARRSRGRISLVSLKIVLAETGEVWSVEVPWDMLVDQFVHHLLDKLSTHIPSDSLISARHIYKFSLQVKRDTGYKVVPSLKTLRDSGIIPGDICRLKAIIKTEFKNRPVGNIIHSPTEDHPSPVSDERDILPKRIRPNEDARLLFQAAKDGDKSTVLRLVGTGRVDVDVLDYEAETALMYAAKKGHLETVRTLLELGADPNAKSWNGFTPLFMAASYGHSGVAVELLDFGAEITKTGMRSCCMAMCHAVGNDHTELAALLLARGALLKHRCGYLNSQVESGNVTAVKYLIAGGANNVNSIWTVEKSLLTWDYKVLSIETIWTPLMMAASKGHIGMVQILLDSGADVNFVRPNGETALTLAKKNRHAEVVALLSSLMRDVIQPPQD